MPDADHQLPELLAPAGDWDCLKAAVENGADAVYFGLERFNARLRARNFSEDDLPGVIQFLHRRGVKGYVTFNTLVFSDELADAEQHLRAIISAGVDAAIVQDIGICRLIRSISPDFPIHASTQMTITSLRGLEFARQAGCNLVVLARECSIREIKQIQAAQSPPASDPLAAHPAMPLEVFVHGALCVAYSGQCLTSESLGGRSANRGECAQACRMPYALFSDGAEVPLGDRKYLLSPQDLAGVEVLPELIAAGVRSLKIEGRLKSPEYVANITRIYREAIDRNGAGQASIGQGLIARAEAQTRYEMEMAFSRGLSTGWLNGIDNQRLVHGRFAKKRGVFLGEITSIATQTVRIRLAAPVQAGDGVVFESGHSEDQEQGGRLYEVRPEGDGAWLAFGREAIDFSRLKPGDKIYKTSDPRLEGRLRRTFTNEKPIFRRPVRFSVYGQAGRPLKLVASDDAGQSAARESALLLQPAARHPLTAALLQEQLSRLGGTEFFLDDLDNFLRGEVMLPLSELNRVRRETVEALRLERARGRKWELHSTPATDLEALPRKEMMPKGPDKDPAELIVLVRNLAQLEAVLACGIRTVYCELEDLKKYGEAVSRFRAWHHGSAGTAPTGEPAAIFLAPPRIFKMGEEWTARLIQSAGADGILARNYDHLQLFAGERWIGDFSLNIANHLAAQYFREAYGLERLTISYDLNLRQVEALLLRAPPAWFEVTIHQHMPMFHMEHCVFCAFLSSGTDYTNCGRPCDRHALELRDRVGARHPVKADAGCRNTVFNARAQTGAEYFERLSRLGLRKFRLEFLEEEPAQVRATIRQYQRLMAGEISGETLWRELKLTHQLGVTRGAMERAER